MSQISDSLRAKIMNGCLKLTTWQLVITAIGYQSFLRGLTVAYSKPSKEVDDIVQSLTEALET